MSETQVRAWASGLLYRKPRPIRRHQVRPLPIAREVRTEPLTPGLRPKPDLGDVPGFHQPFIRGDYYDDDETDRQRRQA